MFKNKLFVTILFPFILLFGCQGDNSSSDATFRMGKVSIEQVDPSTARVMWQAATNSVTSREEMGYEVHLSQKPNFTPDTTTLYTTVFGVTEAKITGLEIGPTYYVLVIAVEKSGNQTKERNYLAITLNDGENFSVQRIIHVTDARTDLGLIVANSKQPEIITIHGTKNSQGNLTSVTDIIHSINSDDPTVPSKSVHYNFKKDSTEIIFTEKYVDAWTKYRKLKLERLNRKKKTADLTLLEQNTDNGGETVLAEAKNVPVPDSFLETPSGSCRKDKNCDFGDIISVCLKNEALGMINTVMGKFCDVVPSVLDSLIKLSDFLHHLKGGKGSFCKPFDLPTENCSASPVNNFKNTLDTANAAGNATDIMLCKNNLLSTPRCLAAFTNFAKSSASMAKSAKECKPTDNEQKSSGWCSPKGPRAGVKGDPHLYTFDKLSYDFQAVGEFIFVKSTIPDDPFEVQVRLTPVGDRTDVSVIQAVAMNVAGDRVGLYRGQEPMLYINGVPNELLENSISLPNGGRVAKYGSRYRVGWPGGDRLIELRGNVSTIYLNDNQKSKIMGLLGNADGDPTNDITTRSGGSLGTSFSFFMLYPTYANSWRISPEDSLFDYAPGESTETFTIYNFPRILARASDLDPTTYAAAEKICREAGITDKVFLEDCILDVALTGNPEFAEFVEGLTEPQATINVAPPPLPQLGTSNFGQLNGSIYDAVNQQAINSANVRLTINGLPLLGTTPKYTTNGLYQTDIVSVGSGYKLAITASGYIAEQVFNLNVPDGQTKEVEPVHLIPNRYEGQTASITGTVRSAIDNRMVSGLKINVRRYINQRMGEIIQTVQTDSSGKFRLKKLNSGNYTLEVYGEEFATNYVTARSIGGKTTNINIVMSPPLGDAIYRIVLTWDNQDDLDAHLTGPSVQGGRFHLHFNRPGAVDSDEEPYAWLDRDDKNGFGPESMTIFKLQSGGEYRYSVHDYKNSASTSSHALGNSAARVDVYSQDGLEESFTVPNKEGTLWTVFEIDLNGVIIPVNTIGYEVNQGGNYSSTSQAPANSLGQTDYLPIVLQSTKQ